MTLDASRLEALIVARARTIGKAVALGDLLKPLARFAPAELTPGAWRGRLAEVVGELRARDVLDAAHRLRDTDELVRRIGRNSARTWPELADRVLPGLALGIAADDGKLHARLAGRDAWAAAIVGRAFALWVDGAPLSLPAVCDALVWRELDLPGKPKRCPPEIRAKFVQRLLGSDAGPPDRLVRVLAAREVGAPRPELRALRDALVRGWLAGRTLGGSRTGASDVPSAAGSTSADEVQSPASEALNAPASTSEGEPRSPAGEAPSAAGSTSADEPQSPAGESPGAASPVPDDGPPSFASEVPAGIEPTPEAGPPSFASDVLSAAGSVPPEGRFGDRKVFVSAVWHELRRNPRWSAVTLDELKARLVAAHRAGELALARADLVAAMDPELVAASEISSDGASFHFIVKEPAT